MRDGSLQTAVSKAPIPSLAIRNSLALRRFRYSTRVSRDPGDDLLPLEAVVPRLPPSWRHTSITVPNALRLLAKPHKLPVAPDFSADVLPERCRMGYFFTVGTINGSMVSGNSNGTVSGASQTVLLHC